jgi:hypothetical protein
MIVSAADYNYGEALQKSILFYEFQMAGKLPPDMRTNWRGDSCLNDGSDVGLDLTGGWFDAGDHVKFNLPMAYTVSMLAWSVYEYKDELEKSGQLPYVMAQIKWASDYLIKCHPEKYVYYYQVGDGNGDHRWWVPAEVIDVQAARPSAKVTKQNPGSTVTAETAAALAATAAVFKDSNPSYAATCLQHAKDLFDFAETTQSDKGYTEALNFYTSNSGWWDELSWAGAWIYLASNDKEYLDKSEQYVSKWGLEDRTDYIAYKWGQCWDDVHYGAQLLLAKITNKDLYKVSMERHFDYWSVGYEGQKITYTPKGLAHLTSWGVLRHSTTTAFLACVYADWSGCSPSKVDTYTKFAKQQADYALGSSGRSYVVGFGTNPPKHPHHRTAHSSWRDTQEEPKNHRHTLYGALVGGPSSNDSYTDSIGDYVSNEVACDYNAGFVGLLAKMYGEYGGNPIPGFKAVEEISNTEIYVIAEVADASYGQFRSYLHNKSGWPARVCDKLSFRYFLDLSEYVAAGNDPAQIETDIIYSSASSIKISSPKVYDTSKNIYYVEIDLTGTKVFPGSDMDHKKEIQFRIAPPSGAEWDSSNDFSFLGIKNSDGEEVYELPIYDNGALIFGKEPDGSTPSNTPIPITTIPPKTTDPVKSTPKPTVLKGDVNNDGNVNSTDYALIKKYLLGTIADFPDESGKLAADVDSNASINSTDYALMKRFILGLIGEFPS